LTLGHGCVGATTPRPQHSSPRRPVPPGRTRTPRSGDVLSFPWARPKVTNHRARGEQASQRQLYQGPAGPMTPSSAPRFKTTNHLLPHPRTGAALRLPSPHHTRHPRLTGPAHVLGDALYHWHGRPRLVAWMPLQCTLWLRPRTPRFLTEDRPACRPTCGTDGVSRQEGRSVSSISARLPWLSPAD
jgi:hypothetical protein